ncbi:hypothetical protein GYMLUDRAFT_89747 [Collybiopsis luxurians FD-317 M1]|nr:hypothetical protein GYMLUDRAFT_89747 [Collybiopsis luxurians FD-317 M1]
MPSSDNYSSQAVPRRGNQRLVGARQYSVSDTELSLPSVRLHRPDISSSHNGVKSLSRYDPSYEPRLPSWMYSHPPRPSAPPALHYSVSPYARIPLPSQSSVPGPIILHPLLRVPNSAPSFDLYHNQANHPAETSAFNIDLSFSPEEIGRVLMAAAADIFEPATHPPLPSLTIIHQLLPWYITVHRSVLEHVTVLDVFRTLSQELHKRIPESRSQPSNSRQTHRRMEILQGKRRFLGLRAVDGGEDIWELITMY